MATETCFTADYQTMAGWGGYANFTVNSTQARTGTYSYRSQLPTAQFQHYLMASLTSRSEYYLQCCFHSSAFGGSGGAAWQFLKWLNGTTVLGGLKIDGDGIITAFTGDFASLVGTAIAPLGASAWGVLEVRVKIHDSAGAIQVRYNGALILDAQGDTKPGAETDFGTVYFGGIAYNTTSYYDDIVICNTTGDRMNSWPNGVKAYVLRPTGAGNAAEWTPSTGNNWDCVDEAPVSQTDYIYPTAADQRDSYACGDLPAEVRQISSVILDIWGQLVGSPAINQVKGAVRLSGTDYDSAALTIPSSFSRTPVVMDDCPDGGDWTVSKVNGAEIGIVSAN